MLDEDGDDQKDGRNDNEPELFLQTMLVVMMLVRAALAMLMFMRMCHIFTNFGAKVRRFHCNSVAKYNYQELEN